MTDPDFIPYAARPMRFIGLRDKDGCQIKTYSVVYGDAAFEPSRFEPGLDAALAELPPMDLAAGRPGLAFAILHQGLTGDYIILCWWDRENELPTRVYLRDGASWRPARGGESFCVWDLEIIWFERQAYVEHMLAGGEASCRAYLESRFGDAGRGH